MFQSRVSFVLTRFIFQILCFSLIITSCSSQVKLNRLSHRYGKVPNKVIWLQIPGLSYEQLSILKLMGNNLQDQSEFEKFHCAGSLSNFSLAAVRGETEFSFISQMTGMSATDRCSDYEALPLWEIDSRKNFSVGLFSDKAQKASCSKERSRFYKGVTKWIMSKASAEKTRETVQLFHSDEDGLFKKGETYYDRSCSSGECFSSYDENIKNTLTRFVKDKNFYMYIAKITSYEKVLQKGNLNKIYDELSRISELISFLRKIVRDEYDASLLVTSSASRELTLPKGESDWKNKLSGRKAIVARKTQTQSPVFVYGANAESFCGVFNENEVAKRLLTL